MKPALVSLIELPRRIKRFVLLSADLLSFPFVLFAAMALRYESLHPPGLAEHPLGLLGISGLTVAALAYRGVYRAVTRAFDERFLHGLLEAVGVVVVVLSVGAATRWLPIPRTVPFIYAFFVFLWVWGTRSAIRRSVLVLSRTSVPAIRIAIYGAGSAGRQLLAALRSSPEYRPVAFFDDGKELVGNMVHGLHVYAGSSVPRMARLLGFDEVLIALPSVTKARRREVVAQIEPANVRVRTLPGISELVGGNVSIADIQDVDITDLLGRDAVPPSEDLLTRDVRGKSVMVTGAGGSIGSELCRQVLAQGPKRLVLVDVSEYALYAVDRELRTIGHNVELVSVLGTVLNERRMAHLMTHHAIDTVYHAAAYKHVPMVECNPFEGINNNAYGTWQAARAAIRARVPTFVLISTDKAVRPTNVMGATKRFAELALQALAAQPDVPTRFCMVRFGNVLGSSGSVVPLFREQIARGGPVTVTHPEVTRYFMTIPEAAQLVIQAGAMGQGGDVFVLDMGEPIKVVDLARKMIRLCGKSVRPDATLGGSAIQIVYSGLRPGEKLYEELLIGDNVSSTDHPRIMRAMERMLPLREIESSLAHMKQLAEQNDVRGAKRALSDLIDGYIPDMEAVSVDGGSPIEPPRTEMTHPISGAFLARA